jgi:nitrite reductase/ring-hydroxylating ferredoxin subunit/uncharacterized membrane protein
VSLEIKQTVDAAPSQPWVESAGKVLEQLAAAVFPDGGAGQVVTDALHGTWLGHPLHPVLTDLPAGSWTLAAALDALDMFGESDNFSNGADAAVGLGIAGATAAAVTGLNDWRHTSGRARRVGVLHALLNVVALTLYVVSLVLRRSGARGAGRATGFLGFGVVIVSTYLGGDLVYDERIGVDRSSERALPRKFTRVMADDDLPEGELHKATVRGAGILLLKRDGRIHALADTCSHLGCSLADGRLEGDTVVCPCHGSTFGIEDGRVVHGPATFPQPVLETRVENGQIEVRLAR